MTYREAIQKLQKDIDQVYDNAGYMRDKATLIEKKVWNKVRDLTREAYMELGRLDNSITDQRGEQDLKFDL